jgi:hypothetical protein
MCSRVASRCYRDCKRRRPLRRQRPRRTPRQTRQLADVCFSILRAWQTSPSQCWHDPNVHAHAGASALSGKLASAHMNKLAPGPAPGGPSDLAPEVTRGRHGSISAASAEAPRSGTEPRVGSSLVLHGSVRRSGQVRFITRPESRTMSVTRPLMLPPSTVT